MARNPFHLSISQKINKDLKGSYRRWLRAWPCRSLFLIMNVTAILFLGRLLPFNKRLSRQNLPPSSDRWPYVLQPQTGVFVKAYIRKWVRKKSAWSKRQDDLHVRELHSSCQPAYGSVVWNLLTVIKPRRHMVIIRTVRGF